MNTFPQIKISYSLNIPEDQKTFVRSPDDVFNYMREIWEDIEYRESFYMICLSTSNLVIGYYLVSLGGLRATFTDIRMIVQVALMSNASSVIILHNHPSGNKRPSEADKNITKRVKLALKLMDICLHDHIIMLNNDYFSFANEGLL